MLVDLGARCGLMRDQTVASADNMHVPGKSCCQHPMQLATSWSILYSFVDDFSAEGRGDDSMSAKCRCSLMAPMLVMLPL